MQLPSGPPSARSVGATCLAWDQVTAGASPVALTISMLPWPNISGIRLLSGLMQVRILPAAPLPGGVKVARRPVKPRGVGASPTLAANFTEGRQIEAGCACPENRIGSNPRSERYRRPPPILTLNERKAHEDRSPSSKPVALSPELQATSSHSHSAHRKAEHRFPSGETVWLETAIDHRLVAQKQSLRSITGRSRSVTCRDDPPSPFGLRRTGHHSPGS